MKKLFVILLMALLCVTVVNPAFSNEYPSKAVVAVVPFSPGGGNDIIVRLIGKYITPSLGGSLVVENKPGAGGQVGWTSVAKARPDGYTVCATSHPSMALVKTLRANVPFEMSDFVYVCNFQIDPLIWVVNKDGNFKTAQDVVDYAKQNPGKLNVAGDGPQSNVQLQHLVNSNVLDIQTNFVPYSGSGPALTALLGKQVDVALTTLSAAVSHIESGRLVPVVMFYDEKIEGINIKSSKEIFDLDIPSAGTALRGIAVPKGTPSEAISVLENAVKEVTEMPEFLAQARDLGLIIKFMSTAESSQLAEDSLAIVSEYKEYF